MGYKSVSVTLTPTQVKPIFTVGQLFKVGEHKRIFGLVKAVDDTKEDETTITVVKGYRPAPRSVLKNRRTVFSKIKGRII